MRVNKTQFFLCNIFYCIIGLLQIIEAHKRVFAAKQKRRPLTKHERNEIFRLVSEQKRLSDQLEAMPIPGFNFTVGSTDSPSSSKTETASNTQKA